MPALPPTPPHRFQALMLTALACLASTSLTAAPITDAEMQEILTIKPASEAEIIKPGNIQARYTEDGTSLNIAVLNGEDGIDFVTQFQGSNVGLEDLNHWNASTYFQAFRVDADKVRINTRLFLPKGGEIGGVVPTPGYISLTYRNFVNAAQRFHQFLVARQVAASASQSNPPTRLTGTPATPVAGTNLAANSAGASTAAPTMDQRQWTFPEINAAFSQLSELKREPFAASVKDTLLSGRGNITEVGRCNFLDDSKRHGKHCLKITLDNDQPRAVLYFSKSSQDELSALEVGDGYRFTNCTVISMTDYGFWTTVTCDMP